MKTTLFICFLLVSQSSFAQYYYDDEFPSKKHALGFKVRMPVGGLNYVGWIHDQVGFEALASVLTVGITNNSTTLKMIGLALRGRTLYDSRTFPYAGIGFTRWVEDHDGLSFGPGGITTEHQSFIGNGINLFIGIEYFLEQPANVAMDFEVGYGNTKFHTINIGALSYGGGIHFYF